MKNILIKKTIPIIIILLIVLTGCHAGKGKRTEGKKVFVTSYYFPNYHTDDPRNIVNKGRGWSEWELVKAARPRFPGHHQPNVPAWGYTDEKDPKVMEQKIEAAADHGIDCFIFDWYMYEDGPFLNQCIDDGFLKAKNCDKIQFALMWANPDLIRDKSYLGKLKNFFVDFPSS